MTVPARRSSRARPRASDGRGPRLVCGSACGSGDAGGDNMPRICPRMRATGCRKWRYATIARYQSRLPPSEETSERIVYATFFSIVTARPTSPLLSRRPAAQACVPTAATTTPARVSMNDTTCQRIEWGRNANGWTSVR